MKVRFKRWIILGFFARCSSECKDERAEDPSSPKARASFRLLRFRKLSVGRGIGRLIRSFRNVYSIFIYRGEEEEEVEMVIGFPTDVKHLTHIGWNGSITTTTSNDDDKSKGESMGCLGNMNAPEIASLPAISLEQLEMAMAAQAHPSKASCSTNTLQLDDGI